MVQAAAKQPLDQSVIGTVRRVPGAFGDASRVREFRYTVYSENLEQTLKLLSCQKTISLIDKRDPKYRRMFISAT